MFKISASILAANHAYLARDVQNAEEGGVDYLHIDITDGHYTDNLTFGFKTVSDIRKVTKLPINVHLAVYNTNQHINNFIDAGADIITIQFEACPHPIRTINQIKTNNKKVAIAISPTTCIRQIETILHDVDQINVMGVEPGFGGQVLRTETFSRISLLKKYISNNHLKTKISVDGGVNLDNIPQMLKKGVDILVMGSMVFEGDIKNNIKEIKNNIKRGVIS